MLSLLFFNFNLMVLINQRIPSELKLILPSQGHRLTKATCLKKEITAPFLAPRHRNTLSLLTASISFPPTFS